MATVFTNKLKRQSKLFAVILFLLWCFILGFVIFRYWLFVNDSDGTMSHIADTLFFVVSGLGVILIGFVGCFVSRLYTMLIEYSERVVHEHDVALKHEREQVRIKRQLTNNINHELKTPICSILGYLEMIIGNERLEKKTIVSFARKSYDQAERLRRLMLDLSTITRIEEASDMVEREGVNVTHLITSIIEDTLPQAEQQGINVVSDITQDVNVNGNSSLLYSIFRNLVDNAIAYSGARRVHIFMPYESPTHYRFVIRDDGIGVDEEHLPYLFERFYRVDKGRSRKLGGTGLGLSIVKNAVIFHGGTILARIASSGGLEFEFTLHK